VLCRSCVCLTEMFVLDVVVQRPYMVHSHKKSLNGQKLLGRRTRDPRVVADCWQQSDL
jgi:hypothetical protein